MHDEDDILEDEAIQLFKEYVRRQCCWGTDKAENIVTRLFNHNNSYYIKVETFCETRTVSNKERVYNPGLIVFFNYYRLMILLMVYKLIQQHLLLSIPHYLLKLHYIILFLILIILLYVVNVMETEEQDVHVEMDITLV